jgi:hypothetical protein
MKYIKKPIVIEAFELGKDIFDMTYDRFEEKE